MPDLQYRRISHKTHHNNHGHVERDESWVPVKVLMFMLLLFLPIKAPLSEGCNSKGINNTTPPVVLYIPIVL